MGSTAQTISTSNQLHSTLYPLTHPIHPPKPSTCVSPPLPPLSSPPALPTPRSTPSSPRSPLLWAASLLTSPPSPHPSALRSLPLLPPSPARAALLLPPVLLPSRALPTLPSAASPLTPQALLVPPPPRPPLSPSRSEMLPALPPALLRALPRPPVLPTPTTSLPWALSLVVSLLLPVSCKRVDTLNRFLPTSSQNVSFDSFFDRLATSAMS